jgi:hypothetical protein
MVCVSGFVLKTGCYRFCLSQSCTQIQKWNLVLSAEFYLLQKYSQAMPEAQAHIYFTLMQSKENS